MFWGLIIKAQAATYYVDGNVASSGNGLSWATAFKTIVEGKNAATQSGDIVEISGGTYNESITTAYSGVTFKGSSAVGHNDPVIVIYISIGHDNVTIENITLQGGSSYNLYLNKAATLNDLTLKAGDRGISVGSFSGTAVFNRCLIKNHTSTSYLVYVPANAGNVTWNNCRFEGNAGRYYFIGGSTTHTFNNCLVVGNERGFLYVPSGINATVNFNNCIFAGNPSGQDQLKHVIDNSGTGVVTAKNSILLPHPLFGDTYNWTNLTDGGGNLYTLPLFQSGRRPALLILGVDDQGGLNYFRNVATELVNKGLKGVFGLSSTHNVSAANWSTMQTLVSEGHEIASHTRRHLYMTNLNGILIRYTGSATTATVTISNNTLSTTINGSPGLSYDLTSTSYDTLTELRAAINGQANYSSTLDGGAAALSIWLADCNAQDINGVDYDVNLDSSRYYNEELSNSKSDIETGIGNNYVTKTFIPPYNSSNSTLEDAIKNAGYTGGRGPSGGNNYLMSNINIYKIYTIAFPDTIKTSNVERNTAGLLEWLKFIGGDLFLYAHSTGDFSIDNWRTFLNAVEDSGVLVKTLQDATQYIKDNGTDSGDGKTYTRTFSDNANYALQYTSPAIDTGTDVSLTTDYAGNNIYGTPDIGAYEYQPPYTMGTDEVTTSAAIRVYGDEKFRNKTATSSATTADLSITIPNTDRTQWLDVQISTWDNTGTRHKVWTASSTVSGLTNTIHTVGDLEANKYYNVKVDNVLGQNITGDNCTGGICKSNSSGKITFTYTGTYSDHTFDVEQGDNTSPVRSSGSPSGTLTWNTTSATLSLTTDENATCKYGVSSSTAYGSIANTFSTTGSTTHNAGLTGLSSNNSYTYYVRCQDTVGNANSDDYTISFSVAAGDSGKIISSPSGGFKILINNNAQKTTEKKVTLTLKGGSNTRYVYVSEDDWGFSSPIRYSYDSGKEKIKVDFWLSGSEGLRNIYAKFCITEDRCSEVVSSSITYETYKKEDIETVFEITPEEKTPSFTGFIPSEAKDFIKETIEKIIPPKEEKDKISFLIEEISKLKRVFVDNITIPKFPHFKFLETQNLRFVQSFQKELEVLTGSEFDIEIKPKKQVKKIVALFDDKEYAFENIGGDVLSARLKASEVKGDYFINTKITYADETEEFQNILVTVSPYGYVFAATKEGQLRIKNANVYIYFLNPKTDKYELWDAVSFKQENPVKTNENGEYSFLVPPGKYYLKVEKKSYVTKTNDPFEIENMVINKNLEMNKRAAVLKYIIFGIGAFAAILILIFAVKSIFLKRKSSI